MTRAFRLAIFVVASGIGILMYALAAPLVTASSPSEVGWAKQSTASRKQPDTAIMTDEEPAKTEAQIMAMRTQTIEAALLAEQRDSEWAPGMEEQIARSLKATGVARTRLISVWCRSTLCTAELTHESRHELEKLPFALRIPGLSKSFMRRDGLSGDRPMRTVAFFARDGYSLPR